MRLLNSLMMQRVSAGVTHAAGRPSSARRWEMVSAVRQHVLAMLVVASGSGALPIRQAQSRLLQSAQLASQQMSLPPCRPRLPRVHICGSCAGVLLLLLLLLALLPPLLPVMVLMLPVLLLPTLLLLLPSTDTPPV